MDIHENYSQITGLATKKELLEYIEKRFITGFIGSLASIEEHFFDLFNDEEWEKYWTPLREEILNKCNAQKRLAIKELEKYDFSKIREKPSTIKGRERNYNK